MKGEMQLEKLSLQKILLSLVGFIVLWTVVTDAWSYSNYFFDFSNGSYIYGYISRLIWVLPAILLIVKYNDYLKYSKKELFSRPYFDKSLIIVLGISSVIVFITMFVNHRSFWFNDEVDFVLIIIKFIIVGCVEEIVFRGWGYNALANVATEKKAILISTVLFILLHWPAYFIKLYRFGTFDIVTMLMQSFSALIWGIIFCMLLKKGKSIWNPIIIHAIYDTMSVLFVG